MVQNSLLTVTNLFTLRWGVTKSFTTSALFEEFIFTTFQGARLWINTFTGNFISN